MYDVVLLIERPLTELDASQVTSLHESIEEPVRYHLLIPVDDAAARMEASFGAVAGHEMVSPLNTVDAEQIDAAQAQLEKVAGKAIATSVALLVADGREADGAPTHRDPITALADAVAEHGAAEAIILTRPHVVAEFFHVDWTSRARRKLNVPTLHLLEHETFDEQSSGGGEGASLI
ncbi:MAG: hypothetical protein ACRDP1_08225 [Nocardioidaceae bacterium]